MTVRMSAALPPLEMNGLAPIEEGLVQDPHPSERRIIIAVVDVAERVDPKADGNWQPKVRLSQVEYLQGSLRDRGAKLLGAAYTKRTGAMQVFDDEFEGNVTDIGVGAGGDDPDDETDE